MIELSSVPIVRLATIGNTAIRSSEMGEVLPRTNVSTISKLPYSVNHDNKILDNALYKDTKLQ